MSRNKELEMLMELVRNSCAELGFVESERWVTFMMITCA
jgi:hypothetical protein